MKKILLMIIISSLSMSILAQDSFEQNSPEKRAQKQTEWMNENLSLNDVQFGQVGALNLEYAKKMETLKSRDGRISKLKQAKGLMREKDEKLKKVLSKDQFEKYLKRKNELKNEYKVKRKNR